MLQIDKNKQLALYLYTDQSVVFARLSPSVVVADAGAAGLLRAAGRWCPDTIL